MGDCIFLRVATAVFADSTSHIPYCDNRVSTQCEVTCNDGTVNQIMRNVTEVGTDVSGRYQFWLLFWLLVLSWIGMAVVVSLSDTICFELLGEFLQRRFDAKDKSLLSGINSRHVFLRQGQF